MNDILSTMIRGKKRRRGVRARARALPRGLPHRPRRDGVLAVALHHRRRHGCRRDPRRRAHRFRDRRRRQPAAPEVTGEDGAASHDAGPGDPDPRRRTRPRSSDRGLVAWVVREGGVEPPRPFGHTDLNRARLPIPPLALEAGSGYPTADGRSQSAGPPLSRCGGTSRPDPVPRRNVPPHPRPVPPGWRHITAQPRPTTQSAATPRAPKLPLTPPTGRQRGVPAHGRYARRHRSGGV